MSFRVGIEEDGDVEGTGRRVLPEFEGLEDEDEFEGLTMDECLRYRDEGIRCAMDGKFEEALRAWRQSIGILEGLGRISEVVDKELEAKIWDMRAQAEMQLEHSFLAIKAAEKAVGLCPRFFGAVLSLGRAQVMFGEVKLGLETLEQAKSLCDDDALIESLRIEIEMVAKQLSELEASGVDTTKRIDVKIEN